MSEIDSFSCDSFSLASSFSMDNSFILESISRSSCVSFEDNSSVEYSTISDDTANNHSIFEL